MVFPMSKSWKILIFMFSILGILIFMVLNEKQPPLYYQTVTKIRHLFIRDMKKKYDLSTYGVRGSYMDGVKAIFISFRKESIADIPETRILLVNCIEDLKNKVNSNETLRPFLHTYPYTNENIKISLSFKHAFLANGSPSVAHAFNMKEMVCYSYDDPKEICLVTLLEEPYSEALRIVKEAGRLSLPKTSTSPNQNKTPALSEKAAPQLLSNSPQTT